MGFAFLQAIALQHTNPLNDTYGHWPMKLDTAQEQLASLMERLYSQGLDEYGSLPHDSPRDDNTWFDYVQFGDFPTPTSLRRLEGVGLFDYVVPEDIYTYAIQRGHLSEEVKKQLPGGLHSYTYITRACAMGGVLEYRKEYLNEQHRWDVTLPLTDIRTGYNQLFYYHSMELTFPPTKSRQKAGNRVSKNRDFP
jgi:hypothetical protein